ncbi:MAG: hypothetical protein M3R01_14530 [Actinomycetota bacterium]|nr:hypothetical protein [Actinomycetota bacterium]
MKTQDRNFPSPALEVDHAGEDPKEDLVGQPVGILGSGAAQVARHRSAQPPEQPLEGPALSRLRRGQHDGEALSVAAAHHFGIGSSRTQLDASRVTKSTRHRAGRERFEERFPSDRHRAITYALQHIVGLIEEAPDFDTPMNRRRRTADRHG